MDIDSNETMMRLAQARRAAGDEEGAQAAAGIVRSDHANRREGGVRHPEEYRVEAIIAAFDGDSDLVMSALENGIQRGMRDPLVFRDPAFAAMRDDPRFIALRNQLEGILAGERARVLQLICFDNPALAEWQPLPETCEGIESADKRAG